MFDKIEFFYIGYVSVWKWHKLKERSRKLRDELAKLREKSIKSKDKLATPKEKYKN